MTVVLRDQISKIEMAKMIVVGMFPQAIDESLREDALTKETYVHYWLPYGHIEIRHEKEFYKAVLVQP